MGAQVRYEFTIEDRQYIPTHLSVQRQEFSTGGRLQIAIPRTDEPSSCEHISTKHDLLVY